MSVEGELRVELRVEAGHVERVSVVSTRRTDVSAAMVGRPVEQALVLVPSLFALCGAAHLSAALDACERALGIEVIPVVRRARRLVCALEAIENHAFQFMASWAALLERAPDVASLRRIRAATFELRRWATGGLPWGQLGGSAVAANAAVAPLLLELNEAVNAVVPRASLEEPRLAAWSRSSESIPAGFIDAVLEAGASDFGRTTTPLLPARPASWFQEQLQTPGFSAQPTLDGGAAESGALALTREHRAVAAALGIRGRTLLTRLIAQLDNLCALTSEVAQIAHDLRPACRGSGASNGSGAGAGVALTSRGPLAHAVEIESGQVAAWRSVAPTEWTFHPHGVVEEALLGAPASDLQRRARWLVAALDPCVACTVQVSGNGDA